MEALPDDQFSLSASYGAGAGQFQEAGISSVICGPCDIMQAQSLGAIAAGPAQRLKSHFFCKRRASRRTVSK